MSPGQAKVAGASAHSHDAVFEEHFSPRSQPKVPSDLVWIETEPSWQALARRRLEYGTTRFSTTLRYEDSFGVDGSLTAGLKNAGAELGATYQNFESTQWDFEGEFAQV